MTFIDLHCDSLFRAYSGKFKDLTNQPDFMVDIRRMKEAGQLGQVFAIFMPYGLSEAEQLAGDDAYYESCLTIFRNTLEQNADDFAFAGSIGEIETNRSAGKISGLLSIEDGRIIRGNLERIKKVYEDGIRLITLTWNSPNCFGYPGSFDAGEMAKGLNDFGKEAIPYLNKLGIMIDVSHLSDGGFWDVLEFSEKPVLASHSNSRALTPHHRNLSDEMIKALANNGGIAGLNFSPDFLQNERNCKESRLIDMMCHIKHMVDVGGIDFVALGSDLDGIRGKLEINSPTKIPLIFDALVKEGFSDDQVEKIAYENALRFFADVL